MISTALATAEGLTVRRGRLARAGSDNRRTRDTISDAVRPLAVPPAAAIWSIASLIQSQSANGDGLAVGGGGAGGRVWGSPDDDQQIRSE
jgi:hypothetical protein